MCANCERLTRQNAVLKRLLRVSRDWFARRQCQLRPSGVLAFGKKIDTDQCYQCEVVELVRSMDEIIGKDFG